MFHIVASSVDLGCSTQVSTYAASYNQFGAHQILTIEAILFCTEISSCELNLLFSLLGALSGY